MESFEGLLKTIDYHFKQLQFMQKTTAFGAMLRRKQWARVQQKLNVPFIMKVSIVVIMCMLLTAQLLMARDGFGQSMNEKQITLELHDASLRSALNRIERLSGLRLAYILEQVAKYKSINLEKDTRSVAATLELILAATRLDFKQDNNTILIYPKEKKLAASGEAPAEIHADKIIQGKVINEKGEPVSGVSVYVKGNASNGTVTNENGFYKMEVPDNAATLVFSFIGMETLEITISGKTELNATLKLRAIQQEEVIVVGYGTKKKANLTGAVSSVKMDDVLGNRPAATTGTLLQGVVPGLQILSATGEPGAGFSFNIRGTNSINGGGPLILVDNVPINGPLNQIDPNEIESVTVLKDAGSAAIYGARAAFGVVLITTKKAGKDQKMQLTYNNNFAFSSPGKLPAKATPLQTVQSYKDMGYNPYWTGQDVEVWLGLLNDYQQNPGTYPSGYAIVGGNRYQLKETDVLKDIMSGNAFQQNHNFSVSGGSAKTAYRVSFGTTNNDGILVTNKDRYKRNNIRAFLATDVTSWLTTQLDASYSNAIKSLGNTTGFSNYFGSAVSLPSYFPADTVTINGVTLPTQAPKNVLNHVVPTKDRNDDIRLYGKAIARPVKGLTVVGEYTYDRLNNVYTYYDKRFVYNNGSTFNPDQTAPFSTYQKYNAFTNYFATNIYGTYEKSLNHAHNFTVMAGFNQEKSYFEFLNATKSEMINDNLPSISQAILPGKKWKRWILVWT